MLYAEHFYDALIIGQITDDEYWSNRKGPTSWLEILWAAFDKIFQKGPHNRSRNLNSVIGAKQ